MNAPPLWLRTSTPSRRDSKVIAADYMFVPMGSIVQQAIADLRLQNRKRDHSTIRDRTSAIYLAKRTATRAPAGMRVPGGGACARATPEPLTSISMPDSCANSMTWRSGLPTNVGTTAPPSTSTTTVPVVTGGAGNAGAASGASAGGGTSASRDVLRLAGCRDATLAGAGAGAAAAADASSSCGASA